MTTNVLDRASTALEDFAAASTPKDKEVARTALEGALAAAVQQAVAQGPASLDDKALADLLAGLRRRRLFKELFGFTTALGDAGIRTPALHLQRAQAAIELKELPITMRELYTLLHSADTTAFYNGEARGLLGRVGKQQYVDGARHGASSVHAAHLRIAIEEYAAGYLAQRGNKAPGWVANAYYHGVNLIAVVWRAERDRIAVASTLRKAGLQLQTARELAEDLLADLVPYAQAQLTKAADENPDLWSLASVGEALLAVERKTALARGWGTAESWLGEYASKAVEASDPFKLYGTLRQLREVWQVSADDRQRGAALGVLQAAVAHLAGALEVSLPEAAGLRAERGQYEKLIKGIGPESFAWIFKAMEHSAGIGRVRERASGDTIGTGFLFEGAELGVRSLRRSKLLLTNAHVVSDKPCDWEIKACRPADVDVEFQRILADGSKRPASSMVLKVQRIVWSSQYDHLDATILELAGEGLERLPTLPFIPFDLVDRPDASVDTAVVIGYPNGRDLSFTSRNNAIRRDEEGLHYGWRYKERPQHRFVHYESSTEPGQSGSPVFNAELTGVYALHHMGARYDHHGADIEGAPESQQIVKLNGKCDSTGRPIRWVANEGILIKSIVEAARADLGGTAVATQEGRWGFGLLRG